MAYVKPSRFMGMLYDSVSDLVPTSKVKDLNPGGRTQHSN